MNLPNALTVGRIFLVPLLVVVLLTKFEGRLIFGVRKELIGAAIFGLGSPSCSSPRRWCPSCRWTSRRPGWWP